MNDCIPIMLHIEHIHIQINYCALFLNLHLDESKQQRQDGDDNVVVTLRVQPLGNIVRQR